MARLPKKLYKRPPPAVYCGGSTPTVLNKERKAHHIYIYILININICIYIFTHTHIYILYIYIYIYI